MMWMKMQHDEEWKQQPGGDEPQRKMRSEKTRQSVSAALKERSQGWALPLVPPYSRVVPLVSLHRQDLRIASLVAVHLFLLTAGYVLVHLRLLPLVVLRFCLLVVVVRPVRVQQKQYVRPGCRHPCLPARQRSWFLPLPPISQKEEERQGKKK